MPSYDFACWVKMLVGNTLRYLYFSQKIGFDISCKVCMMCQIYFLGKMSNIISLSSAEFSHSMVQSGYNHLTRRNLIMLPPLEAFIFNDRFICHSLLAYALHLAFTTTEICVI